MDKEQRNKLIYQNYEKGKYSQEQLAELYGLSQSRISAIIIAQKQGVFSKKKQGRKSELSESNFEELAKLLRKSPLDFGFSVWDKYSIRSLIDSQFNVTYHPNSISKLMNKIGFSSQKPQKKDYRQNSDKKQEFVEHTAKSLKKSKR